MMVKKTSKNQVKYVDTCHGELTFWDIDGT